MRVEYNELLVKQGVTHHYPMTEAGGGVVDDLITGAAEYRGTCGGVEGVDFAFQQTDRRGDNTALRLFGTSNTGITFPLNNITTNLLSGRSSASFTAWIWPQAPGTASTLFTLPSANTYFAFYGLLSSANALVLGFSSTSTEAADLLTSNASTDLAQALGWVHLGFTLTLGATSNSLVDIYINGERFASSTTLDTNSTFWTLGTPTTAFPRIGASGTGTNPFNGFIQDAAFFRKRLSAAEILEQRHVGLLLFNQKPPRNPAQGYYSIHHLNL
jgi:hypothetical protein